ncbi:beta-ketoacyl-ACP synthase III [Paraneptunicella aestuarii]|uniref:beta-ketoacyl-ACP synthase III n=1 Tax=Paraneptunicella aestuarii TaxID=2831148 RepID=UPI001E4BB197|nr:beta-ketoacyl-ACP synthase III [Paraneptunicella aestuarii]UAA39748.1 beta-ketoacyl-ACP synthase III [Paraneptunicella aestuarii]
MTRVVISGSGLWTPEHSISNEELVDCYNAYADKFNNENAAAIEAGEVEAKPHSSAEFIQKASGIKSRFVYTREGVLDIDRMCPIIEERGEDELSNQAEIAVYAAKKALASAHLEASDIDAIIVACAYTQRAYPAIAIEVQQELGIKGVAYDMLGACSAATFGLRNAHDMVKAGSAKRVMVINPELVTPQINYRSRDSHFIFGDVAVATIVESIDTVKTRVMYEVLSTASETLFSSNIRSNFSYMSRANSVDPFGEDKLFHQEGRKVFKELCPMVVDHISDHIGKFQMQPTDIKRWWLHQANSNMNSFVAKKLLGRDPGLNEAPVILDTYANTASAGSLIAFNLYHYDLEDGDLGLLSSFGAGYSIASLLLKKIINE